MQKRPSVCSPVFNRPRYSTSIYQADVSHRATTRSIPGNPALTRHSLHRLPTCCITSPPFTPRARRAQIPIARAALPTCPFPRFPPLEVFGRRPQLFAAPTMVGRHPKTFTLADIKRALTPPANLRERADLCTTFSGGAARGTLETAGQDATRWSRTRRTDIDRLCPEHTVGVSRHRPQACIIDSGYAIVMVVHAHRAAGNLSHGTC